MVQKNWDGGKSDVTLLAWRHVVVGVVAFAALGALVLLLPVHVVFQLPFSALDFQEHVNVTRRLVQSQVVRGRRSCVVAGRV